MTLAGGYLPMTPVARLAASSKLMKDDLAGLQVAHGQAQGEARCASPVRVAQIEPVRQIVEEELETVWDNKKPAQEALDNAVARGNAVLLAQAQVPAAEPKAGKTSKRHKWVVRRRAGARLRHRCGGALAWKATWPDCALPRHWVLVPSSRRRRSTAARRG